MIFSIHGLLRSRPALSSFPSQFCRVFRNQPAANFVDRCDSAGGGGRPTDYRRSCCCSVSRSNSLSQRAQPRPQLHCRSCSPWRGTCSCNGRFPVLEPSLLAALWQLRIEAAFLCHALGAVTLAMELPKCCWMQPPNSYVADQEAIADTGHSFFALDFSRQPNYLLVSSNSQNLCR